MARSKPVGLYSPEARRELQEFRKQRLHHTVGSTVLLLLYLALGLAVTIVTVVLLNPYLPIYVYVATGLTIAMCVIAFRYIYFYWCLIRYWGDFHRHNHLDLEALMARDWPNLKFQVTTKGGALETVERSVAELEQFCYRHPEKANRISAEIITERRDEAVALDQRFAGGPLEVTAVLLPPAYEAPRGTRLKARALHYMVELRRGGFNRKPGRSFIVHLDDETLITDDQLLVLADYLSDQPKAVSEGPIYYPLDWTQAPWICRTMESIRPFGCSECAHVMQNPPPTHLHGSNLVIDEEVENLVGWDLGLVEGQAYIAEDLVFGLTTYAAVGDGGFGWHGAAMLEQPPFSLYWAFRQRQRWVLGALQGTQALWCNPDFAGLRRRQKVKLHVSIVYRVLTYSLGFPVGLGGLMFLIRNILTGTLSPQQHFYVSIWTVLMAISGVAWLLSYQVGLARNLQYQRLSLPRRLQQHLVVLLLTPVAGLAETIGPFTAGLKWILGLRRVSWTPTLKVSTAAPVVRATP